MKTTIRALVPAACILATAAGVGLYWASEEQAQAASRVAVVESFSGVELRGAAKVRIEQVDAEHEPRVELSASDAVLELVEVAVSGGTLLIDVDDDVRGRDLAVAIATPTPLTKIASSGAIELTAVGLRSSEIAVVDRGAGNYRLDELEADKLVVTARGAANFTLAGAVGSQTVDIAGAGAYDAAALRCEIAEIHIKGAGSASVYATETLDVTIAGTGIVRYAGDPDVRPRIYGAGVVERINSQ